ncbi:DNA-binding transcriptional regulator, GntR family [Saccharopolyspora antimicrobica]|uniref:DNA-binding transcriptional regulator, GntR family n=1 Tax=Saccharopolyspora antimicrobica TaxID=455193 RepID=A0A1I4S150_9PSEU|nr:GntR family transcriptional regulator [Saccharopolyspora antimicrobica]RKT87542.1 GntR family transcriptional regulator [Saccharopolyspora antimicrobica]SFM58266.1 DNA-binding transcriptional regulator, GntR family [Saccharopolyspora antimicrobica]
MSPAPRHLTPLTGEGLLADRTYAALKSAVLDGTLPPGTGLSVPELARQLDVSRSPVREAVQRLIHDGLATHVPHRGAEVSRVDIEDLRQLYVVRELLEGLAARLATENLDADGLEQLRAILDEHEQALAADADNAAHIELDMRFHRAVREFADNPHLLATLEPITGRAHFALHSLWRSDDAPRLALDEHRAVVDAMASGDPEMAEAAARRHIARLRIRLGQATARTTERRRLGR